MKIAVMMLLLAGTAYGQTVNPSGGGAALPINLTAVATDGSGNGVQATTHGLSIPGNCIASGGTATAYACTTSPTFVPVAGDHIQFDANVANTGSATLSVNGATAAIMHKVGGSSNLAANDLLAAHWVSMTFDGVYWQLEGQLGNAYATSTQLATETTRATTAESFLAPLASPVLTGTPTAPTPTAGDNSTKVATTNYADRVAGVAQSTANTALAAVPVLPTTSTILFDYKMPGSDSGNAYFTDYSAADGSSIGAGNCPFIAAHAPAPLATGGAVFGANFTNQTGCNVPALSAPIRTFIAMVAPATMTSTTSNPGGTVVLGSSAGPGSGPTYEMKSNTHATGYTMGTLNSGAWASQSTDVSAGLSCVSYNTGTAGDSTLDLFGINGVGVGSYFAQGRTPALASGNWQLGTSNISGTYYLIGTMYRAVGWSTYLTQGQIAQACQLLQQDALSKGAVNPTSALNTSTTPTLACTGDSIQAATGGTPPCTLLVGLPALTTSVFAIGGAVVNDTIDQIPTREVGSCTTAAPNNAINEASTNDLANGSTPTVTMVNASRWALAVRAGWTKKGCSGKILLQTPISRLQIDNGNANAMTGSTITAAGSGYTSLPTVTFGGSCTTFPTVTNLIVYSVSGITLINPTTYGLGCTGLTMTISGGGGSGATATPVMTVAGNGTRDAFVALAEATAISSGFDGVIDAGKDPILGCNFCFLNGAYYTSDFIHPVTAGKQVIANDYSAAYLYWASAPYLYAKAVTTATYAMGYADGYLTTTGTATNQAFTLPNCNSMMGLVYRIDNSQSAFTESVVGFSAAQPINGLTTAITIPSNGSLALRATSNTTNAGGCHWNY